MRMYDIITRKKNGASPTETVEDRAAKDFRGVVRLREERLQQKKTARAMYSFSACLVLIVVIMGVVTMNNYDKIVLHRRSRLELEMILGLHSNTRCIDSIWKERCKRRRITMREDLIRLGYIKIKYGINNIPQN